MTSLTSSELQAGLDSLPLWKLEKSRITRTWVLDSFEQAISLINQVADVAERAGHHPDILLEGRQLTLRLSTHDVHAVTSRDLELAAALDALR